MFAIVVRKKSAVILAYEPFTDVLQRLNIDNKNTFLSEQILVTTSVYQTGE